jgi:hypothetical protein
MKIVVYEPFTHFIPTGVGWVEGFTDLGHETFGLPSNDFSILEINEPMDVLVMFGPEESRSEEIIKFKQQFPSTKIVIVCFKYKEFYQKLESSVDLWVEHTFKHRLSEEVFRKKGLKFAYIPLGVSKHKFYPINDIKKYDISFIGQLEHHGNRGQDKLLFPVMEKYPNGFFSGFSYKGRNYPFIPHSDINAIYNQTKINLNFHYPDQRREDSIDDTYRQDFNGRVFEIAFSGNFQVCDLPHLKDIGMDKGIAIADESNWMDVVDYYMKNEEERNSMAAISHLLASKHTWEHRMSDLLSKL